MNIMRLILSTALLTGLLGLAACSATTEGDRLIARGNAFAGAGTDLNRGEKLVRQGRRDLEKARKKRRKAEDSIEDAEARIAKGEALIDGARRKLASTQ